MPMTTYPARAHRAARLRDERIAHRLRSVAHHTAWNARSAAVADGTLPPAPPADTPTPEWMQWYNRARAWEDLDPATIAARTAADQAEQRLAALLAAYRTARAPLMRPANPTLPNDAYSLTGATTGGTPIPTWDDGYGPMWIVLEEFGPWLTPCGIVRARTWNDAYSCAEDEIIPDFEFDAYGIDVDDLDQDGNDMPEGLTYRGSGTPSNSTGTGGARLQTPYADSNGIALRLLSSKDLREYKIGLQWELVASCEECYPTATVAIDDRM